MLSTSSTVDGRTKDDFEKKNRTKAKFD